jgi:transposase
MKDQTTISKRFIGLDVHKHYLIALGVDEQLNVVLPAQRVEFTRLEVWIQKTLTAQDAVALEMTTNTWQLYDELSPHAHSVTVIHPPHVALITRSQVMTDKIAASILARLLAKGLLVGIWVPPVEVRELRALVAQRSKLTRLATQAKNRLQAVLQRHHLVPPAGNLFHADQQAWWQTLPVGKLEQLNLQSDLETLRFAEAQLTHLISMMNEIAAHDERATHLIHLPGFGVITVLTVLAAIGEIDRFEDAKHLVGYAGLGARIHDSGLTTRTGRITKAGRKDLRSALVEAAQVAANSHPHWKAELKRLEPRLGRNKAIVAIARKLLVTVWQVLSHQATDRFAEPEIVARKLMQFTYQIGKNNRSADQSAAHFVRHNLDRLQLGADLHEIPWGTKKKPIPLPPSTLPQKKVSDVPHTK